MSDPSAVGDTFGWRTTQGATLPETLQHIQDAVYTLMMRLARQSYHGHKVIATPSIKLDDEGFISVGMKIGDATDPKWASVMTAPE